MSLFLLALPLDERIGKLLGVREGVPGAEDGVTSPLGPRILSRKSSRPSPRRDGVGWARPGFLPWMMFSSWSSEYTNSDGPL